jgi:hypothetical protein
MIGWIIAVVALALAHKNAQQGAAVNAGGPVVTVGAPSFGVIQSNNVRIAREPVVSTFQDWQATPGATSVPTGSRQDNLVDKNGTAVSDSVVNQMAGLAQYGQGPQIINPPAAVSGGAGGGAPSGGGTPASGGSPNVPTGGFAPGGGGGFTASRKGISSN